MAADQHHVGVRLGDARGDRAHADLGHQLDADARFAIAFLRSWISCARSSIE
jgi:hypothetical protein